MGIRVSFIEMEPVLWRHLKIRTQKNREFYKKLPVLIKEDIKFLAVNTAVNSDKLSIDEGRIRCCKEKGCSSYFATLSNSLKW